MFGPPTHFEESEKLAKRLRTIRELDGALVCRDLSIPVDHRVGYGELKLSARNPEDRHGPATGFPARSHHLS